MSNRHWHKRLRQSLEITRRSRRSVKIKQNANADAQPDDRSPPPGSDPNTLVCEERDAGNETNDELVDCRQSHAQVRDNDDTLLSGTPETETMSTAADLIVDDFAEKDTEQNNKPSQFGPTVERNDEQENRVMQREEREGKDITATNLVMGDNDGWSLTGKNSTGLLTDVSGMIHSESSLSNATSLSINTEYNLPPKDARNNEATMQAVSSSSKEQPSTVWGHILSCFGLCGENEREEEDIDDTLSQFVLHNVKQDLKKKKSNRRVSKGNKKEVGSGVLLHKINKIKKIIHVLEAKKAECVANPRGDESKEDPRIAMLNSKVETMVTTLEMQIKDLVAESKQLDSVIDTADDEIDSVVMELALDDYEVIHGTNTEETEDSVSYFISRLFHCKFGKEEPTSFSPNCSMISEDSESLISDEVPVGRKKKRGT